MASSQDGGNGSDFDLNRAVNEALDARDDVVDYEITESGIEHVLVKVTETTEDGDPRVVLYRIQHEPRPDGTDDVHWEYLGPAADGESE
mgnify:CR=1 FL=1